MHSKPYLLFQNNDRGKKKKSGVGYAICKNKWGDLWDKRIVNFMSLPKKGDQRDEKVDIYFIINKQLFNSQQFKYSCPNI